MRGFLWDPQGPYILQLAWVPHTFGGLTPPDPLISHTGVIAFYPANFELPGSFRFRVRSKHATDRQTDRHRPSFHNAPSCGGRRIIFLTTYKPNSYLLWDGNLYSSFQRYKYIIMVRFVEVYIPSYRGVSWGWSGSGWVVMPQKIIVAIISPLKYM